MNTVEIIDNKIKQAFENKNCKRLYKLEDEYLLLAQIHKENWDKETADFYYSRSDECARLSDIVSWMAKKILENERK